MLEVWADLLEITKKDKYKTLLKRYYRSRLFQPLLEGKDPLTNMHANTTIPEILGCARAYEAFSFHLRIPEWIESDAVIYVNGESQGRTADSSRFHTIQRTWRDGDEVSMILPIGVRFIPLPDDERIGAFRYGPEVLAVLCEEERILHVETDDIASEIEMENEREWGSWRFFFKTANQDPVMQLRRIRDIGYEPYQIYFKTRRR